MIFYYIIQAVLIIADTKNKSPFYDYFDVLNEFFFVEVGLN